jgi:uncharacterized protein (DUF1684 family)
MMSELEAFRQEKDAFFKYAPFPQSPLMPEQQRGFRGLSYYPENPALRLEVEVQPFANPERVQMLTNTGEVQTYLKWGTFEFEVEGQKAELVIFRDTQGGFFLPFQDATNGMETYSAGRYLEPRRLPDGRLLVDFNYAYNPYCAYNEAWSCPIPPKENRLRVPIRAGEKNFKLAGG